MDVGPAWVETVIIRKPASRQPFRSIPIGPIRNEPSASGRLGIVTDVFGAEAGSIPVQPAAAAPCGNPAPTRPGRPAGPAIRTDRPDIARRFAAGRTGGGADPARRRAVPVPVAVPCGPPAARRTSWHRRADGPRKDVRRDESGARRLRTASGDRQTGRTPAMDWAKPGRGPGRLEFLLVFPLRLLEEQVRLRLAALVRPGTTAPPDLFHFKNSAWIASIAALRSFAESPSRYSPSLIVFRRWDFLKWPMPTLKANDTSASNSSWFSATPWTL